MTRRIWVTEECHQWLRSYQEATGGGREMQDPVGRKRGLVALDLAEGTFETLKSYHIAGETFSDTLIRVARGRLGDKEN